jgi:hypothetical protein
MDPLLQQSALMACTRNAHPNDGNGHDLFIPHDKVPRARAKEVTYGLITCLIRPKKIEEPNRTRFIAGGGRVHYRINAGMPTAHLLTIKLLINSVISTPRARFFTMDIKNFYLCMPMTRYEFMQLKLSNMPEDIIEHITCLTSQHPIGTFTVESARACTCSRKRGLLPRSSWQKG